MTILDLTDRVFGKLIVVDRELDPKYKKGYAAVWYCLCECGGFRRVTTPCLLHRGVNHCGECEKPNPGRIKTSLVGKRCGKLTALFQAESIKGRTAWMCQCDCGNYRKVLTHVFVGKKVYSCGCTNTGKGGRRQKYFYEQIEGVCRIDRKPEQ